MKTQFAITLLILGLTTAGGLTKIVVAQDESVKNEPAQLEVTIEIPRLNVSEYHRPYVAVWIQDNDRNLVANLAVWYQMTKGDQGEGTKWLPDLRQWWRRSGRSLELPVDGVTAATRPAGVHKIKVQKGDKQLDDLSPGEYELIVEAAREVGGREIIEIPFSWPADKATTRVASGETELGEVTLTVKP